MTEPLISFLCSAYGTEQFVAGTIESVRAQTRADWELVVVDNGMSAELAGIVAPYLDDPRIRLLRQHGAHVSEGVNAAAAVATGRFFVALHSDDQVVPEYCARMGEVLHRHPEVDVLACDAYLFSSTTGEVFPRSYLRAAGVRLRGTAPHRVTLAEVIGGVVPFYVGVVRRGSWFAAGGYSSDPPDVEDLALWTRLLLAGADMRMISDRLGRYRIMEESTSRGPSSATRQQHSREQVCRAAATASGRPQDAEALEAGLRRTRYVQALRRARWAFTEGDVATAREEAATAYSERRTLRSAAILAALTVAPGPLRRIHPLKRRAGHRLSMVLGRLARVTRRQAGPADGSSVA